MAIFQQAGGYRDPMKAMTIKALEARAKERADAATAATQVPAQIASPWQGMSHLAGVLGSGIEQRQADNATADARQRLTSLMSGIKDPENPDMATIAQIQGLDPEEARFLTQNMLAARREQRGYQHEDLAREDTQQFQHGETVAGQGFTASQNELNRQADLKKQEIADATAAGRQEDQQKATEDLARINAQLDVAKKGAEIDLNTQNIPVANAAREAEAGRLGLVKGSPEYNDYVTTGNYPAKPASTNIYNQGEAPAFQKKSDELAATRMDDYVKTGAQATTFMAQIKTLGELGKQIGTGKMAQLVQRLAPYAQMAGVDIAGLDEGQAYNAIVAKMVPQMRVAGSGTTSDFDAQNFMKSLPNIGNTPQGNAIIQATFDALTQHQIKSAELAAKAQSGQMTWQDAEAGMRALPDPYETFKKSMGDQGAGDGGALPTPQTQDEFDKLAPGTHYIDPDDGEEHVK